MTRATRPFFRIDAKTLARRLLGQRLVRLLDDGTRLAGVIVETEAYVGVRDRASHAFQGRRTPRNDAMYHQPGTAYVYFTYGMHWCFNVVCGEPDEPAAVLVRALQPTEGLDAIRRLRRRPLPDHLLCSGPARLCQAFAIDRRLNTIDLASDHRLWIERTPTPIGRVRTSPRIGVDRAGPWAKKPLRWYLQGNPHVSARPR